LGTEQKRLYLRKRKPIQRHQGEESYIEAKPEIRFYLSVLKSSTRKDLREQGGPQEMYSGFRDLGVSEEKTDENL